MKNKNGAGPKRKMGPNVLSTAWLGAAVVFVEWFDSCTTYGWHHPDKDGPSIIRSIGMLVSEDRHAVTLSTSRSEGGRYVDQITIPRRVIRVMKELST